VLVDVPMDVFSAEVDSHFFTRLDNNTRRYASLARCQTAREIVRRMAEARQPLIYAGGGIVWRRRGKSCTRSSITLGIPSRTA
jgi:acetolactate synthase-1/2/3 large subunit